MGGYNSGALNAKGFSSSISSGRIPQASHLTYSGAFNQEYFAVGKRTDKLLDLQRGFAVCNPPMKIKELGDTNMFLGLFLKSSLDGQPRIRPIHAVIVLDISGSMGGKLSNKPDNLKTRLDLSRQAILMFFKKLRPNDIFSLVTFSDKAETLIPSEFVGDLDEKAVEAVVNRQFKMGGTVLKEGFIEAEKNFNSFKYTKGGQKQYERRIIMLTDVCDNSFDNQTQFVNRLSGSQISCTIIGVSEEFRSETCEKLVEVAGFNYFCATEQTDLKKYLFDNFDYTFFKAASKIQIQINTNQLCMIEVFGSSDAHKVHTYGNPALKNKTNFIVTKMETAFPSELSKNKEVEEVTQGGLLLVKLVPQDSSIRQFVGKLKLTYCSLEGASQQQQYQLHYKWQAEQFSSSETMVKAAGLFYYTYCMKNILERIHNPETELSDLNKSEYLQQLNELKEAVKVDKREQLEKVTKIVEEYHKEVVPVEEPK